MDMIESLFRSVETHFQMFPELKQETKFVGSIQGRIQLITEKKIEEYKVKFPYLSDKQIKDAALKYARYIASVRNCYAYSHGACSDIGLSGIAWNTNWTGDKFQKNKELAVNTQFAPIGTASVKGVVDHELGHEIDRLLGLCSHGDFIKLRSKEIANGKKYIKENLSDYANTNAAEFIAEAWSEYLNNKKPRPIAVAVGSLIRKLYTKKYQSSNA